ncbi:MAG: DUF4194 domain-containing protein [Natronospirillum sp.]|uniref:DUF4194 domain-containing protein n=1 Tax=Natronospirillum sp. TaxID=2812955 RepID=UPI0025DA4686|nr:DUF4194 domain-containing protein [Natronospirillum sp.]MCH8550913.1 DUF4194 domain-containing protein [Natronospirillum sp.]
MLHELEQQLAAKDVTLAEFSDLCLRLLDYSVLSREDSQVEQHLYDRYVRCEAEVRDYLSVLHIRLLHDTQFQFIRVYPPGAEVPGQASDTDLTVGTPLRQRLNQQEVAVVLVLRTLYDQGVREARVDEQGAVSTTVEDIGISMRNLLGRSLPENLTERRALWRRLRQWRLIRHNDSEDAEASAADRLVQIRPAIVSLVSDTVLQQLEQPEQTAKAGTEVADATDTDTIEPLPQTESVTETP